MKQLKRRWVACYLVEFLDERLVEVFGNSAWFYRLDYKHWYCLGPNQETLFIEKSPRNYKEFKVVGQAYGENDE